jgi:hypothetical protein
LDHQEGQINKKIQSAANNQILIFFDKYSLSWHQSTRKFEAYVGNLEGAEISNRSFLNFVPKLKVVLDAVQKPDALVAI